MNSVKLFLAICSILCASIVISSVDSLSDKLSNNPLDRSAASERLPLTKDKLLALISQSQAQLQRLHISDRSPEESSCLRRSPSLKKSAAKRLNKKKAKLVFNSVIGAIREQFHSSQPNSSFVPIRSTLSGTAIVAKQGQNKVSTEYELKVEAVRFITYSPKVRLVCKINVIKGLVKMFRLASFECINPSSDYGNICYQNPTMAT